MSFYFDKFSFLSFFFCVVWLEFPSGEIKKNVSFAIVLKLTLGWPLVGLKSVLKSSHKHTSLEGHTKGETDGLQRMTSSFIYLLNMNMKEIPDMLCHSLSQSQCYQTTEKTNTRSWGCLTPIYVSSEAMRRVKGCSFLVDLSPWTQLHLHPPCTQHAKKPSPEGLLLQFPPSEWEREKDLVWEPGEWAGGLKKNEGGWRLLRGQLGMWAESRPLPWESISKKTRQSRIWKHALPQLCGFKKFFWFMVSICLNTVCLWTPTSGVEEGKPW